MPKYYFNVDNGIDVATDLEGAELANLDAAISEAVEDHLAFAIEALKARRSLPHAYRIEICDENQKVLAEVPFSDALASLTATS